MNIHAVLGPSHILPHCWAAEACGLDRTSTVPFIDFVPVPLNISVITITTEMLITHLPYKTSTYHACIRVTIL